METKYLKTVSPFTGEKKITGVVAISENGSIVVRELIFEIDKPEDCLGYNFYVKEWKAIPATKEEFDSFYIEQVGVLNNLIKDL